MSEQQKETLRAEKLPEEVSHRRNALGRGLGALLLRQQLSAAAQRAPLLRLPAWAENFERPHQSWLRKVWQRSQPRLPRKPPGA